MDFFESLEGMLVQINNARAVSTRNRYNEVLVVADGGQDAGNFLVKAFWYCGRQIPILRESCWMTHLS